MRSRFWRTSIFWLAVCAAISFLALVYPIYVIRPFRYQGPDELAAALAVMRIRPVLESVLMIAGLVLVLFAWRQDHRWLYKFNASLLAFLVLVFAALSRINIYELMFHPLDVPTFSLASKAKLDGKEEVIAVNIGGAARAYPVRIMAYHHIVNDTLAGFPIVATY
jgi:hypothetical protein